MNRWHYALGTVGIVLLGAGITLSFGAPRVTLVNAGLRMDYPGRSGAAAAAAAAGAVLLAWALPRRAARVGCSLVALVLAGVAGQAFAYRLEADDAGVHSRGLLGTTHVAWKDVARVESGRDAVVVWGPQDTQIRIDTQAFEPTQRAMLDRTVARHVHESRPATSR